MSDSTQISRQARRAEGRRMLVGAILGLLLALALGAGLWMWTDNLGLAAAITGILAILLPGPAAAMTRKRAR